MPASLQHCFAQRRREEEGGAEPLTAASLDLVFRDWPQYRGFVDDEDIRELERTSGNLTRGLLWITGFLAKTWRWAEVGEQGLRYNFGRYREGLQGKSGTLVDLLEGKPPDELVGVPRRSLLRWTYNSK
jgi:hypothetical protein